MFKWSAYLLFFLLPLLLLLRACICSEDKCIESPSSCGPIPRITYPFRLRTDPAGCGNKKFEITCESNVPVVYLGSAKYYVRSINYNNFTIRLSDASLVPLLNSSSNSFLCNQSATAVLDLWWYYGYTDTMELSHGEIFNMFQTLDFISCPSPIANPTSYNYILYKDGSVCAGGSGIRTSLSNNSWNQYWYARVGERPYGVTVGDVVDSCRLELVLAISMPLPLRSSNLISYKDVYDCWDYGFELSWFEGGCLNYIFESNKDPCYYLTNMAILWWRRTFQFPATTPDQT